MELDFWIPKLKIAFEVQGPHHFEDVSQKRIDTLKVSLTALRGIQLVALRLTELKVLGVQRVLWERTKAIDKQPFKFLRSQRQIREGLARQHTLVDAHIHRLVTRYGYSEALPRPLVEEDPNAPFARNLLSYSHVQWEETKDTLGPPRRILAVDLAEGTVLLQIGKWRQHRLLCKLRKKRPVFPTAP